MYQKRNNIGKFWPVPRKGTTYVARSTHNQREAIPLLVIMRDILKLVKNKKELQKIINQKGILINQKEVQEKNYPLTLFDTLSLLPMKKQYRITLSEKKKVTLEEISEKEAQTKIYKIRNKKQLTKKKTQINLTDGRTLISTEKSQTGNSIVFNLKERKIIAILPMEKGRKVFITKGKNAGKVGILEDLKIEGNKHLAEIKTNKTKVNVQTKNIIVIE